MWQVSGVLDNRQAGVGDLLLNDFAMIKRHNLVKLPPQKLGWDTHIQWRGWGKQASRWVLL
jgi:hypothetical protein